MIQCDIIFIGSTKALVVQIQSMHCFKHVSNAFCQIIEIHCKTNFLLAQFTTGELALFTVFSHPNPAPLE